MSKQLDFISLYRLAPILFILADYYIGGAGRGHPSRHILFIGLAPSHVGIAPMYAVAG